LTWTGPVAAGTPFVDGEYRGTGTSYGRGREPLAIEATLVLAGDTARAEIDLPARTLRYELDASFVGGFFALREVTGEESLQRIGRGFCGERHCTYSAGLLGLFNHRETLTRLDDGSILAVGHVWSPLFESAWEIRYEPVDAGALDEATAAQP
jgi:hypothetical protein